MKIAPIFLSILFASFTPADAQTSAGAADEAAVLQAERDLCDAYRKGDVAVIQRDVMEDYVLTDSHGKISGRDSDLEDARKHDPTYEVFENLGMKVRVHGDTAVVTGRTHLKGTSGGKTFEAEVEFTDTLVKDAGRWRLLAVHVSKPPEGSKKN